MHCFFSPSRSCECVPEGVWAACDVFKEPVRAKATSVIEKLSISQPH